MNQILDNNDGKEKINNNIPLLLDNMGLAQKFVQVFPEDVTENPNEFFGQPNTLKQLAFSSKGKSEERF